MRLSIDANVLIYFVDLDAARDDLDPTAILGPSSGDGEAADSAAGRVQHHHAGAALRVQDTETHPCPTKQDSVGTQDQGETLAVGRGGVATRRDLHGVAHRAGGEGGSHGAILRGYFVHLGLSTADHQGREAKKGQDSRKDRAEPALGQGLPRRIGGAVQGMDGETMRGSRGGTTPPR